jgi:hypothetical protein
MYHPNDVVFKPEDRTIDPIKRDQIKRMSESIDSYFSERRKLLTNNRCCCHRDSYHFKHIEQQIDGISVSMTIEESSDNLFFDKPDNINQYGIFKIVKQVNNKFTSNEQSDIYNQLGVLFDYQESNDSRIDKSKIQPAIREVIEKAKLIKDSDNNNSHFGFGQPNLPFFLRNFPINSHSGTLFQPHYSMMGGLPMTIEVPQGMTGMQVMQHMMNLGMGPPQQVVNSGMMGFQMMNQEMLEMEMQNPMNGMQNPMNGMQQPMNGMQQPMNGMQQPMNGMQNPMNGIQNPMNGMQNPMNGMQQLPPPVQNFKYVLSVHIPEEIKNVKHYSYSGIIVCDKFETVCNGNYQELTLLNLHSVSNIEDAVEGLKNIINTYKFFDGQLLSPKEFKKAILERELFPLHEDFKCVICFIPTKNTTSCNHRICFGCRYQQITINKNPKRFRCPSCRKKNELNIFRDEDGENEVDNGD